MRFTPVPYEINGITLWAVEAINNWIDRYCDTKEQAQKRCNELNTCKDHGESLTKGYCNECADNELADNQNANQ